MLWALFSETHLSEINQLDQRINCVFSLTTAKMIEEINCSDHGIQGPVYAINKYPPTAFVCVLGADYNRVSICRIEET